MPDDAYKDDDGADDKANGTDEPVVIRKYANRRLYNTGTTEFVTLDDIRRMVVAGDSFVVVDAKTGRDITSSILAQIVAEHESRGEPVLPHEVLRQIISAYEQGVAAQLSDYLKSSMQAFTDSWRRMDRLGEIGRQNLEVLRDSMATMFTPPGLSRPAARGRGDADGDLADQVNDLQAEIRELRRRLNEVSQTPPATKPGRKPRQGD